MRISDKDNGYARVVKMLTSKAKPALKVGIFGERGSDEHKDSEGLSVADVAAFHEFGLGVPERSFLRGWMEENQDRVADFLKVQCAEAVESQAKDFVKVLERLGLFCVGGIQQRISDGLSPPLAPSTIAAKGSSIPLIDTGQLRTSITYEVDPSG
jgi:hypothetical protein